jgi:hypothetical protein
VRLIQHLATTQTCGVTTAHPRTSHNEAFHGSKRPRIRVRSSRPHVHMAKLSSPTRVGSILQESSRPFLNGRCHFSNRRARGVATSTSGRSHRHITALHNATTFRDANIHTPPHCKRLATVKGPISTRRNPNLSLARDPRIPHGIHKR